MVQLLATTSARDSPDTLDLDEDVSNIMQNMIMQPDDNLDLFSTQRLFAKQPHHWLDELYVPTSSERCNACTPCAAKACKSREEQDIICLNCLEKKACVIKSHQGCVLWPLHMSKNYFSTMRIANNALKTKYESSYRLVHESNLDAFFACKQSSVSAPPPYEEAAVGGETVQEENERQDGDAAGMVKNKTNIGTIPKVKKSQPGVQGSNVQWATCDGTCGQACETMCSALCGDVCVDNCDVSRTLIHKHKVCDGGCKGQCANTCKLLCGHQCVDMCVTACKNHHNTQNTHNTSSTPQHGDANDRLDQLMNLIRTQQSEVASKMDGWQSQFASQMSLLQGQVISQIGNLENKMTMQIDDIQQQLSDHQKCIVDLDKKNYKDKSKSAF